MPVVGFLVRTMDSLPVYRQQDKGEDMSKNEETFAAARQLLSRGGTIAICPEGVSHDAPGLKPIKTGAARISLGAVSTGEVSGLQIIPAGLYYTSKTTFRSSALLDFGKPIAVEPVPLEPDGSLPRDDVKVLSARIESALRAVILDAQHEEELRTISRAERIFSSEPNASADESLAEERQLQQRFVKAYPILQTQQPERLRKLEVRMIRFEEELKQSNVEPDEFAAPTSTSDVFAAIATRSLIFVLTLVPALIGTIVHYPAYRLGGYLATKLYQDTEDMVSTIKIMSAMLLFPLTWIISFLITYLTLGWISAVAIAVVVPFCGYVAILFFEELDRSLGGLRVLTFFLVRRRFFIQLMAERTAIRNEILALGKESPAAE